MLLYTSPLKGRRKLTERRWLVKSWRAGPGDWNNGLPTALAGISSKGDESMEMRPAMSTRCLVSLRDWLSTLFTLTLNIVAPPRLGQVLKDEINKQVTAISYLCRHISNLVLISL